MLRKMNQTVLLVLLVVVAIMTLPHARKYADAKAKRKPQIAEQIDSIVQPSPELAEGLKLEVQDECEVGELVRFDATNSDVDAMVWRILPETPDFEVVGERAFFSGREAGKFLVIIAGAKNGQPFLEHHYLTVAGGIPVVPVDPNAPVSLATRVRGWVSKVPKSDDREQKIRAVAQVFRKLAESPELDVDTVLDATAVANSAVIGDAALEAWIPFLEVLGEHIDTLTADGKLDTADQYRAVWLEIAKGLESSVPKRLAAMVRAEVVKHAQAPPANEAKELHSIVK